MVSSGITRRPVRTGASSSEERSGSPGLHVATRVADDATGLVSIVIELSSNSMVTLAIFNEEGNLVDVPFEGWLWPGRHEVQARVRFDVPGRYKCLLDTPTVRLVKYIEVRIA